MAVQIAQILFSVPRTVARLFNPAREQSYRTMGVHYVSGTRLVAHAVLNEVRAETFPLHVSFESSDIRVVEMTVSREGNGWSVYEMESHGDVRVSAIRRGERVTIPSANDTVLRGDVVVAAVTEKATRRLREIMENPMDAQPGSATRRG
jgi:trk system potassium uptake protein TrkA